MAKANMKGISRIDQDERRTHGWYVRVRLRSGRYASKLFSDKMHGSKKKALEAAASYRDAMTPEAEPKKAAKKAARKPARKAAKKPAKKTAKKAAKKPARKAAKKVARKK
jgi:hypothetical protein